MCRLLSCKFPYSVGINRLIEHFAEKCRTSKEYQGHGWGVTFFDALTNRWKTFKSINPIWEDLPSEPIVTNSALIHARSAFRDQGIEIENNMPFESKRFVFAFNGELKGVKMNIPGSTGAHKLFNLFLRRKEESVMLRLGQLAQLMKKKSEYIKAMNIVVVDKMTNLHYVYSHFNEDPDYFSLHRIANGGYELISSEPLDPHILRTLRNGEVPQIVFNTILGNYTVEVI